MLLHRPIHDEVRALFERGAPLELWGRAEIADHLGCKQSNMPQGLPDPLFTRPKKRGSFWLASDIREFARVKEGRPS